MSSHSKILSLIRKVYEENYRDDSWLSTEEKREQGNDQAEKICKIWQKACARLGDHLEAEVNVTSYSRIDLIDHNDKVAYELKYSGTNYEHEFYKDVFKAITYKAHKDKSLCKLVFISSGKAIRSLEKKLVVREAKKVLSEKGIELELVGLEVPKKVLKAA